MGSSARFTRFAPPDTRSGVLVSSKPRNAPTATVPTSAAGALRARTRRYASASLIIVGSMRADDAAVVPSRALPPAHANTPSAPISSASVAEMPSATARVMAPRTVSAAAARPTLPSTESPPESSPDASDALDAFFAAAAAICDATSGPVTTARKLKSLNEKLNTVVATARPPSAAAAPSPSRRPTNAVSTAPRTGSKSRDATAGSASAQMRASRLFSSFELLSAASETEEADVDGSPGSRSSEEDARGTHRAPRRDRSRSRDRAKPCDGPDASRAHRRAEGPTAALDWTSNARRVGRRDASSTHPSPRWSVTARKRPRDRRSRDGGARHAIDPARGADAHRMRVTSRRGAPRCEEEEEETSAKATIESCAHVVNKVPCRSDVTQATSSGTSVRSLENPLARSFQS